MSVANGLAAAGKLGRGGELEAAGTIPGREVRLEKWTVGGFTVCMDKAMLCVEYSILASHNFSILRVTCSVLERSGKTASGSHASRSSTPHKCPVATAIERAPK